MQLKIIRVEAGYVACVTPSHGDNVRWTTDRPMSQRKLIQRLQEIGFHQQDIGDAFYEADPEWQFREKHE